MASRISRVVDMPGVAPRTWSCSAHEARQPAPARAAPRELGVRVMPMSEIARLGVDRAIEEALDMIWSATDAVHVSLDNDSIDPSCAPGTTAPEPGGLIARELLAMALAVRRRGVPMLDIASQSGRCLRLGSPAARTATARATPMLFDTKARPPSLAGGALRAFRCQSRI